jgi:hypothetical protein
MRLAQQRFADQGGFAAHGGTFDGGTQPGSASPDNNDVMFVRFVFFVVSVNE